MPQTLLEISEDMESLDQILFELGGDVTDENSARVVEAWIDELRNNLSGKADNYCALITTMEKRARVRKEEADRLYKRSKIDEKAADFLRSKLKAVMEDRGVNKLETERYKISVAKNGGLAPLIIFDEKLLPFEFFINPPPIVNREKIRDFLDNEQDVPGADFGPRGTSLRIK